MAKRVFRKSETHTPFSWNGGCTLFSFILKDIELCAFNPVLSGRRYQVKKSAPTMNSLDMCFVCFHVVVCRCIGDLRCTILALIRRMPYLLCSLDYSSTICFPALWISRCSSFRIQLNCRLYFLCTCLLQNTFLAVLTMVYHLLAEMFCIRLLFNMCLPPHGIWYNSLFISARPDIFWF